MKVLFPNTLTTSCLQPVAVTERVARKVKWLSICLLTLRLCLAVFILYAFIFCYLSPGWWIVSPPVPALVTFVIPPLSFIYYISHLNLYRLNDYHGSTTILQHVRPNRLSQTITRTYAIYCISELLMAIVWSINIISLAVWPYEGKDFRNTFSTPPYAWFICALGGTGVQVFLCIMQWFMLTRESLLFQVHFANYRHMMNGQLNVDGTLREPRHGLGQPAEHAQAGYPFEDVELDNIAGPSTRSFV